MIVVAFVVIVAALVTFVVVLRRGLRAAQQGDGADARDRHGGGR